MEQLPEAKIIAMLRNPIELVHAFHMEQLYSFNENEENIVKAWELQKDRVQGQHIPKTCIEPKYLQYGKIAKLGEQIDRLFTNVPEKQRKIVFLDDFKVRTEMIYQEVLEYLLLPDDKRKIFPIVKPAHKRRFRKLESLAYKLPAPLNIYFFKKILWLRSSNNIYAKKAIRFLKKEQLREPMPKEFVRELRDYFAEDVRFLSKLMDRDLSTWLR